ncbi:MAG: hypothetical protein ACE5OS_04855 [Anaerolineae bacterium]
MALTYVNFALLLIAHLAGLVVAVILLIRIKGTPAILATIAFALSFIRDIGAIMRVAFLDRVILQRAAFRTLPWAQGGLGCCCGLLDLIAVVCLIVAIWQAVSATAPEEAAEGAETTWEETESIE